MTAVAWDYATGAATGRFSVKDVPDAHIVCDPVAGDGSSLLYYIGHGIAQQARVDPAASEPAFIAYGSSATTDLRLGLGGWPGIYQWQVEGVSFFFNSPISIPSAHVFYIDECLSGQPKQARFDTAASNQSAFVVSGSPAADPRPSLSRCSRALDERQMVLSAAQLAALTGQLRVLLEDEDELQSANISVSMPSLHGLIDFLSEHQTSTLPSLSITQAGYFAASWSPRKRAKLTIVFHPDGSADWNATDLDAAPPIRQKGTLANHQDEFAAWANA
jgi:hypothetical protein